MRASLWDGGRVSRLTRSSQSAAVVGALIILERGSDPVAGRITRQFPPQYITIVPVPDEASAAGTAAALAEDGAGLIELYGEFTSEGAAAVIQALDGKAAVGVGSFTTEKSSDV